MMVDLALANGAKAVTSEETMSIVTRTASRIILATPRAVFRAFIDAEALVNWLPPAGMTAELQSFDPRPGSGYRLILTCDEAGRGKSPAATDRVTVRFVELDPDTRIVEAVDFESDDPAFGGTMTLTITMTAVTAVTGGTKVTFVAENVPSGVSEQDHRSLMEASLRNLANLLD
ncbi:SRPBCC domain-containing protein [Sphingomonas sp. YL-JM2C]